MPNPRHLPHLVAPSRVQGLDKSSRLADVPDHASIITRCRCGRHKSFHDRALERKHGLPPETTIEELALKLQCSDCGAHGPFRITWCEDRTRGTMECKEHLLIAGWQH